MDEDSFDEINIVDIIDECIAYYVEKEPFIYDSKKNIKDPSINENEQSRLFFDSLANKINELYGRNMSRKLHLIYFHLFFL